MGTIECSQPTSKSSCDSQDFGDISMVIFASPLGHDELKDRWILGISVQIVLLIHDFLAQQFYVKLLRPRCFELN